MLLRIIIILFIAGGALIFYGFQEYTLVSGAKTEPLEIDLAEIENNTSIDNNYINIGPHIALYSGSIFEYEYDRSGNSDYTGNSPLNYTYYPIISESHPYFDEVDKLEKEYGSVDDIPDDLWPGIDYFSVLVRTTDFKIVRDIPDDWRYEENVSGILINKIKSLDNEEKKLLQETFPDMDMEEVLLLEKDRVPGSPIIPYFLLTSGLILIMTGIGIIIKLSRENKGTSPHDNME
ncbi:MAG: hypothetical protein JXJ04_25035 [Spirochaetales bacterium]|nr:hypothetical protein [Spirochaetales bacterium]